MVFKQSRPNSYISAVINPLFPANKCTYKPYNLSQLCPPLFSDILVQWSWEISYL